MKRMRHVELTWTLAASLAAAVIIYTITRSAQTFQKEMPSRSDPIGPDSESLFFFSAFIY